MSTTKNVKIEHIGTGDGRLRLVFMEDGSVDVTEIVAIPEGRDRRNGVGISARPSLRRVSDTDWEDVPPPDVDASLARLLNPVYEVHDHRTGRLVLRRERETADVAKFPGYIAEASRRIKAWRAERA